MTHHEPEPSRITLESYRGYAGLPPLVGLQSMQEAVTKGITVAECVARLLRIHWSLKRLHAVFVERIAATPVYELKMAFSLHAHLLRGACGGIRKARTRDESAAVRPGGIARTQPRYVFR